MKKNFSLYGALLLLFQVLAGCDAAPPPIEAENAGRAITSEASEPTRLVVAFGDSLYAGYRLDAKDGFAPVLQAASAIKGLRRIGVECWCIRRHDVGWQGAAGFRFG